jgi:hypothetical protein
MADSGQWAVAELIDEIQYSATERANTKNEKAQAAGLRCWADEEFPQ